MSEADDALAGRHEAADAAADESAGSVAAAADESAGSAAAAAETAPDRLAEPAAPSAGTADPGITAGAAGDAAVTAAAGEAAPGDAPAGDAQAGTAVADARPGTGAAEGDPDGEPAEPDVADLELEGEIAADYIEGLLDVADLDGDIDMDVEGDRAVVSVVGATLDELVGPRGEVLDALQELTRLAVLRQTGMRTRMMLDIGGYRQRRRAELTELGNDAADEVRRTGVAKTLDAMNAFERKVVHDAVAEAGLQSESEGAEPDRRVVVLPAG